MDGQQQRRALTAATSALRALAAGHATRAVAAAGKAAALDQLGMYAAFVEWVSRAAEEVEEFGRVLPATSLARAAAVQRIADIRDPHGQGFVHVRTERSPRVDRTL